MHHLIILAVFLAAPAADSLAPTVAVRDPADEIRKLRVETSSLRAQLSAERARTEELRLSIGNLHEQSASFRGDAKERERSVIGLQQRISDLMKESGNKDATIAQLEEERSDGNRRWNKHLAYAVGLLALSLLVVTVPLVRMNKRQGMILVSQEALSTDLPNELASLRTLISERPLPQPVKVEREDLSERLLKARDQFGADLRRLAGKIRDYARRRPTNLMRQ